jgi:RNA polymerase sigma-70 factor (ECF subfamily)
MATRDSQPSDHTLAVQGLFVQHHSALQVFILALVPDFNTAQDVLQETFLTITSKAHEFTPETNFLNWARAIARYKVLQATSVRRGETLSATAMESLCAVEIPETDDRRIETLNTCIEKLAPHARRVIELRYQGSHSPPEIARLIGWATKAVNVALSRARSALRDCVARKLAPVPNPEAAL